MSPPPSTPSTSRRRYLRSLAAALGVVVAGCTTDSGTGTDARTGSPPTTRSPAPTPTTDDTGTADRSTDDDSAPPTDAPAPPVVWHRALDGPVSDRPTVHDGTVYAGTEGGSVVALASPDGDARWRTSLEEPVGGSPVVAGDVVLAVAGTVELGSVDVVYALDAATGERRWTHDPGAWRWEVLGVADGVAYLATGDDALGATGETLYALSMVDGTVRWTGEVGDARGGLVTDDAVYVPATGRLYAYGRDGERRWTRELSDYSFGTIAAVGGVLVLAVATDDSRGTLVGLDPATGERRWRFDDWFVSSTTVHDGSLYVGGEHVAAVDPATGESAWTTDEAGFVPRVPVRDGRLYAGGDAVRAIATDDGVVEWSWSPGAGDGGAGDDGTGDGSGDRGDAPSVEGLVPATASAGAGAGDANPTDGGTVYVDSWSEGEPRSRWAFALDGADGTRRWAFTADTELTGLTAGSGDGRAFVGGENGVVYGLDGSG